MAKKKPTEEVEVVAEETVTEVRKAQSKVVDKRVGKPKEQLPIQHTKEMLVALNELMVFFADRLSDGVGLDDISAFWAKLGESGDFRAKLEAAIDGYSQIPAEVKDLSAMEGVELAEVQLAYIPAIVEALRK